MKMRYIRKIVVIFLLAAGLPGLTGCSHIASLFGLSGTYSFTGASIPDAATTFSVAYMPNNTAYFATLSNALTEGLRDRFVRQTKLTQVPEGGDLAFEGEIVMVTEAPAAIGASSDTQSERTTSNRITVTVQVLFTNTIQPEWSFENRRTFTAYYDFDASKLLSSIEGEVVDELVTTLVDNIFNAAVAQW